MNFDEFIDKAAEVLNIKFDGYKIKRVKRRSNSFMRRRNISTYKECLDLIIKNEDFRKEYINHFTINTSEFYRNPKNYEYLQNEILPALLSQNNRLRIWSSACS